MHFRRSHSLWRYQKRFIETLTRIVRSSEVDTKNGVVIHIAGDDPNNTGSPQIEIKVNKDGEFSHIIEQTTRHTSGRPPHHKLVKFDFDNGRYSYYEEHDLDHAVKPYRVWEITLMDRLRANDYQAHVVPLYPQKK